MRDITKLRIKTVAASFVVAVIFFITVGFLSSILIKGCLEINERGLKNIVEEVWEGKQSLEE
jgi:ABC-type phosphate transport system permease subunit